MSQREHWHHTLSPTTQKALSSNALPSPLRKLIHPTRVVLSQDGEQRNWKSRDHRKHRHVPQSPSPDDKPGRNRRSKDILHGILHMTRLEWWNISWWVAVLFTIGSIVWVLNGFGSFLPFILPAKYSKDASESFTGWTAFTGATIFEVGSIFGLWEAWNRDDEIHFGWGVKETVKYAVGRSKPVDNEKTTSSPPADSQSNLTRAPTYTDAELALETNHGKPPRRRWVWFSHDGKYFRELGFLAAFTQWCGATIFWISGFTAIPQIQAAIEEHTGVLDGVFWTPQVVGGSGFIISSILMMLETQTHWWIPKPQSLGWQVGFWNLIGGIGFTLCGALGYVGEVTKTEYQSSLSTFWGSWAFLIGSIVQWYESVNSVE